MGEYCCSLGHNLILEKFLASGSEWAFVLEEDANILENLSSIEELTKKLKGPTILHMGGIEKVVNATTEETFWIKNIVIDFNGNKEILIFETIGNLFGTYGYLVNREAALIAVADNRRLSFPQLADWPSTWRYKVKFCVTDLPYVSVATEGSDLAEGRAVMASKKKSKVMHLSHSRFRGWGKLALNLLLIEPALKSLLGIRFQSVVYENIYLYTYQRLMLRLREAMVGASK
jgi:GR25 family glycosyltransferase involved in LPS biosynthesis